MSKRKLLINEVFETIKSKSEKDTKHGWATDLSDDIEKKLGFIISVKTLSRYHDSFITGVKEETGIETLILNKLSEYLNYKDFADFSGTFIKKDDETNKTRVKISIDKDEESLTEKLSNIIINITNEQYFKMPEFMKKNGLGIMEAILLISFVTCGVLFSGNKKNQKAYGFGNFQEIKPDTEKMYMYWNGENYIATDSSFIRPEIKVIAMDREDFIHLKKIKTPDTITAKSLKKVWYSKKDNVVEFFTSDGSNPENGKELRELTEYMLEKYAR